MQPYHTDCLSNVIYLQIEENLQVLVHQPLHHVVSGGNEELKTDLEKTDRALQFLDQLPGLLFRPHIQCEDEAIVIVGLTVRMTI